MIAGIEKVEFYPHRKEDMITKIAPIAFDREAECPRFEQFVAETFRSSAGLITYMQRLSGYFATGHTKEQKWWLFYGPTASGKSTFVKILHGVLGPYALALPENYFLLSKHETTDFATANLAGVRLATCIETNEGRRLNVARIKAITDEDMISAQLKYENYFEFKPQCKLVLVTNYAPHVPAGDDALWRRLKVVPFTAVVPESKRKPGLADELVNEEGSGILNWMIAGCLDWQENGLGEPEEVKAAIAEYRSSEDTVADFLEAEVERVDGARLSRKDISKAFDEYAKRERVPTMSGKRLAAELQRLRIDKDPKDASRYWTGIKLRGSL